MKKLISMTNLVAAIALAGCATMDNSPVKTMDGALVGGASLKAADFGAIVAALSA